MTAITTNACNICGEKEENVETFLGLRMDGVEDGMSLIPSNQALLHICLSCFRDLSLLCSEYENMPIK